MMKKLKNRSPLEQRVLDFIRRHNLVTGGTLLLAVSGGPDSVCMLRVLFSLREELGISLHIAHLNHRLRGEESDADAAYVSRLARELGIPATVEERDVEGLRIRERLSPEEAAREARYAFLAGVVESVGAGSVAAGHTADDNVETILLHLVRGTGTRGLRGLRPVSRWRSAGKSVTIIRPLLELKRSDTEEYCRENGLEPRIDSSNLSFSPLRNRIRHQLLPLMERYNPQVKEALLRTARISADEFDFIDAEADRAWNDIAEVCDGAVVLDRRKMSGLSPALKRHLLRRAVEEVLGSLKDIEAGHIEDVMDALDKPAGKELHLPGGLLFITEYDRCLLSVDEAALVPFPVIEGETRLNIPGETLFPGWQVKAGFIKKEEMADSPDGFTAYLDAGKTGTALAVRRRRRGDRLYPLGIGKEKKLGEFMIDARIPKAWRDRVPLVCSPEQIVWVAGWRIDDRVKVTRSTEKVLRLEFRQA